MTNSEFSNEFDVLYNNVTSNQAPGLDEYEKSVFLTKAQDDVVKAYFNPKTNKVQEGFDGSERRQIDFSMLVKIFTFKNKIFISASTESPKDSSTHADFQEVTYDQISALVPSISEDIVTSGAITNPNGWSIEKVIITDGSGIVEADIISPFETPIFDNRDNTKSVKLNKDILMFVNEYIIVTRGEQKVRLTVFPINYVEYSRLMSKPYKRPLKFHAWRLLDNSDLNNKAELIVGPNDTITQYTIRYVKRPSPIVLSDLEEGLSVGGTSKESPCELDPILHPEVLQRAVEFAKAAYVGDLTSQIALGQSSQTNIGMLTQSK